MAKAKEVEIKKIAAAKTMRKLMADHLKELDRAVKDGRGKVAWWTSRCMAGFAGGRDERHGGRRRVCRAPLAPSKSKR